MDIVVTVKDMGLVQVLFATGMVVLLLTCAGYLVIVNVANVSTPFMDSLSEAQIQTKKTSSAFRQKLFVASGIMAVGVAMLWRPFT